MNAVVQIRGKINAVLLDNCDKTSIVCSDVVSSIDIVNCKSVSALATYRSLKSHTRESATFNFWNFPD